MPRENDRCRAASGRLTRRRSGWSKTSGSRLAPPIATMTGVPLAITVPSTSASSVAIREVIWTGLS